MNAHSYHDFQKVLPHNIELEQALLGSLLVNNEAYYRVAHQLKAGDFFEPIHREIFSVAADLVKQGKVANPVTIKDFLPANRNLVGDMTVAQYLARLAVEAVTVVDAPSYADGINELAKRRRLISAGQSLIDEAYDADATTDPAEIADRAIEEITGACGQDNETLGAVTFGDAVASAVAMANSAHMSGNRHSRGISYGLAPLEDLIGPLFGGQLIIIGGATKQGKSALVGQMAVGTAQKATPVDFYSGEMTPTELAMREISRRIGVPTRKQKRGELTEAQFEQMVGIQTEAVGWPIMIQNRRLTLQQLKERWRRMVQKRGKQVLILDHVGLLDRDKATSRMENWEFGEVVTRELKATARDLDCPVIACVQLKKNTFAERGPVNEKMLKQIVQRRPRYTDLIGGVERDADFVVIPFRPDVFLAEHEPAEGTELHGVWEILRDEWKGRAQLVLALARDRQWPSYKTVGWDGNSTSFFEIGRDSDDRFEPAQEFASNPMRLF